MCPDMRRYSPQPAPPRLRSSSVRDAVYHPSSHPHHGSARGMRGNLVVPVKKLDAYKGRLTPAQIAEGMNAASENANRLVADAFVLLGAGCVPSALALATLAIEEAGKVPILRRLAVAMSNAECAGAWKEYRSHTSKNVMWTFPSLFAAGARTLEDFRQLFSSDAEHPYILDQLKQIALYTDCLGEAHWSIPHEVIDESLARGVTNIAKILAGSPTHTEEEVALWIEHMAPAFASKDLAFMKQALVRWHDAMKKNGLRGDGPSEFGSFVGGEGGV
jgi:AbiV family abortive infection protein